MYIGESLSGTTFDGLIRRYSMIRLSVDQGDKIKISRHKARCCISEMLPAANKHNKI